MLSEFLYVLSFILILMSYCWDNLRRGSTWKSDIFASLVTAMVFIKIIAHYTSLESYRPEDYENVYLNAVFFFCNLIPSPLNSTCCGWPGPTWEKILTYSFTWNMYFYYFSQVNRLLTGMNEGLCKISKCEASTPI